MSKEDLRERIDGPVAVLPPLGQIRTKSGASFDASQDLWSYREGVETVFLNFTSLKGCSRDFIWLAKAALAWYAEHRSASHMSNLFQRLQHFVQTVGVGERRLLSVTKADIVNYKAILDPQGLTWYLGTLRILFQKWRRLGYSGVDADADHLLKQMRLPGNPKGVAVTTLDPLKGPFSYLEWESLQGALNAQYASGHLVTSDFMLAWLYILLGQRNTQHARLKVCDVVKTMDDQGRPQYAVMMPRAKQQGGTNPRSEFTERPLIEQFGGVLFAYAEQVKAKFEGLLAEASLAPLFPCLEPENMAPGFEYHQTGSGIGARLTQVFSSLSVVSERTGRELQVFALRFRRTIGTRAAEEGHGPLVIAKLLDHTDTQHVMVYSASSPAILKRIDRAMAMQLAPIARAFAGAVENGFSTDGDVAEQIIDFRIDRSGKRMGKCSRCKSCKFNAPIACYTCKSFKPWLHGPHEAVLRFLLDERDRLLRTSDIRIAAINDLTIFAVAAVVQRCAEVLTARLELVHD